eukprot:SAG31_NODE_2268_length_6049_cov_1.979835_4_plen_500_part_00
MVYRVTVSNEAGLLTTTAFQTTLPPESSIWPGAEWISGGTQLRGSFHTPAGKNLKRATAYASGVGIFSMTVNGKNVSDSFLDPGFSTVPSWRMLYRAFDVTQLIQGQGRANAVGVRLGQGKYGYLESYCTPSDSFSPTCRAFLLSLCMEFSDGSRENFTTTASDSWRATTAGNPVFYTHLYHGEQYDARREQVGWDTPDFEPSAPLWSPAVIYAKAQDLGPLSLFTTPPIRITESRAPQRIYKINGSNIWNFDFGQNWAGFATLRLSQKLPSGTMLTMRFAEITHEDGSLFNTYCGKGCASPPYLGEMVGNQANQTDVYITKGSDHEEFTPFSTYHGFRYVSLEGLPSGYIPNSSTLTSHFVHSDTKVTGKIRFKNESADILNKIQKAILYTQRSNFHTIPTDCCQREKRGWMGDAQWTAEEASLNLDTSLFYENFVRTFLDTQQVNGTFRILRHVNSVDNDLTSVAISASEMAFSNLLIDLPLPPLSVHRTGWVQPRC